MTPAQVVSGLRTLAGTSPIHVAAGLRQAADLIERQQVTIAALQAKLEGGAA